MTSTSNQISNITEAAVTNTAALNSLSLFLSLPGCATIVIMHAPPLLATVVYCFCYCFNFVVITCGSLLLLLIASLYNCPLPYYGVGHIMINSYFIVLFLIIGLHVYTWLNKEDLHCFLLTGHENLSNILSVNSCLLGLNFLFVSDIFLVVLIHFSI